MSKKQLWGGFLALAGLAALISFWRFPNNYLFPNFYAEDGNEFAHTIFKKGFWSAVFTPFNGYYIVGLYLIEGLGLCIDALLFRGSFLHLPQSFALAGYAYFGVLAALPWILLRHRLRPHYLLLLVALNAFLPVMTSDKEILGAVGNLKYSFMYIAFLLVLFRLQLSKDDRRFPLVDFALLICAYTNVTVYFLCLVPFAKLAWELYQARRNWRAYLASNYSFWSAFGLGLLLLPQVVLVGVNGLPKMQGYLDAPYEWHKSVEVFFARPFLYGNFYWFYRQLNDFKAVLLGVFLGWAGWKYGGRQNRALYLFTVFAVVITTYLFVANRTGITEIFRKYQNGGGATRYFYTQNLIFYVAVAVFCQHLVENVVVAKRRSAVRALLFLFLLVPVHNTASFGKNAEMQRRGTIFEQALKQCASRARLEVTFEIYPEPPWTMTVPWEWLCNTREIKASL